MTEEAKKSTTSAKSAKAMSPKPATKGEAKKQEPYFQVRFHDKSHANDADDVILSVQGEILQIERGEIVTIPERYKVAAENAQIPQFKQVPNEPRKITGHVKSYPFDLIGPGKSEDFLLARKEGTERSKKLVASSG